MVLRKAPAVLTAVAAFAAREAHADDCPPGSRFKSQDSFTWCEPTVCQSDGQCDPSEVCRPMGLCMQVGDVSGGAALGDASKRLVVTQRCAPDKTCPQTTICSDMGRCMSKDTAAKMGILSTAPQPSASATSTGAAPPKKACGCDAVGARRSPGSALAALGLVALVILRRRTRA